MKGNSWLLMTHETFTALSARLVGTVNIICRFELSSQTFLLVQEKLKDNKKNKNLVKCGE